MHKHKIVYTKTFYVRALVGVLMKGLYEMHGATIKITTYLYEYKKCKLIKSYYLQCILCCWWLHINYKAKCENVPGWKAGKSISVETMSLRRHERTKKTSLLTLSTTAVEDKQFVFVGMSFAVWTGHMNSKSNTETSLSGHCWQSGNIMHPSVLHSISLAGG